MKTTIWSVVLLLGACNPLLSAETTPVLNQAQFEQQMQSVLAEDEEPGKVRKAKELAERHWLSSLQVKAIAARLRDDDARLEFATAAYRRTIDPENFYEVYDAFTRFSKVLRLHDRIRQGPISPHPLPAEAPPAVVDEKALKTMLQALRKEPFENNRLQLARQIVSTSRDSFLSAQVRQLLGCFDFEPNRLEFAKFAFKYTADPEMYFVVQEAFSFAGTREELSRWVQQQSKGPRPGK